MDNIQGSINRIKRLQSSLARFTVMKQLFSQAWPEALGNQPENAELLQRIQIDLDQVMEITMQKIKEIESELVKENT